MAGISLLGTLAGSCCSIITANRLISYRLARLEETVKERAATVERVYALERHSAVVREQMCDLAHRVELIEQERREKST